MRKIGWLELTCLTSLLWAGACADPRGPARVGSDDPDLKIQAIRQDVSTHSETDVAKMVEDLQSDDAAVRFYSIQGLRRLTHDNFGYHFYSSDSDRELAIARWQAWLKQRQQK